MIPRLTIDLPVYNSEETLPASLDALLGQTYTDFELVLSSNASTDGTDEICRDYAARDSRITFHRQPRNIGAGPHHDFVLDRARGELFKWASGDDLYAQTLLERCVEALDAHPEAVLAHSYTGAVDEHDRVLQMLEYPLNTGDPRPSERLRSMLRDGDDMPGAIRADDFYGVIRTDVLHRMPPQGSYYHYDQVWMAELALHGPFVIVPEWLYFRRHHSRRAFNANPTVRAWCSNLDPKRADRLRHPTVRLVAEFPIGFVAAIHRAPISPAERRACLVQLARWGASRVGRRLPGGPRAETLPLPEPPTSVSVHDLVAGRAGR